MNQTFNQEGRKAGSGRPIRCCRCKHVHCEADRVDVPEKGQPRGSFVQVCPKCGAHSFFMVRTDGKNAKDASEWAPAAIENAPQSKIENS
jgi:hypothetical protein